MGNAWSWDGPGQGSNCKGQIGHISDVGNRCPLGSLGGREWGKETGWKLPPKEPKLLCLQSGS